MTNKEGLSFLNIRLIPRAKRNQVDEVSTDGILKVRVTAPALEGKANMALIKFLSEILEIPTSRISIISGMKSRNKRVAIQDLDIGEINRKVTLSSGKKKETGNS